MKRGISLNSVEKSLSHSADKIRGRTLLCFERVPISKSFKQRRGEASRFFSKFFLSHRNENFRKRSLLFLRKFLVSKSFTDEKGGITFFRRKVSVSQFRKISWASLQYFRKFGVSKNFMHTRGYHVFPSKIFGLTVPKNFVSIPSMFQKIWGIEKFYA